MENKQFLIEIAVGDAKLKSSLKKALTDPGVQKQLGILGEGITEHLEKDVGRAVSILGKVDWASLLGEKDFEHLQQLVAKTVSANKDLIKSFIKTGDTKGIQDVIELVSALGSELKAINPGQTVDGLARSMASFIKVIAPLSGKLNEMSGSAQNIQNIFNNFDTSTINKKIQDVSRKAQSALGKYGTDAVKDAYLAKIQQTDEWVERLEDVLLDKKGLNSYLDGFKTAEAIAEEMLKIMTQIDGINPLARPKQLALFVQQLEGLQGKLQPMIPTLDASSIKKEVKTVSSDVEGVLKKVENQLEESFNKIIEKKLGSIKVSVDVPTEDKLIADINAVIEKVNAKGTNSFKLVGAESAINAAQKQILENTKKWHEDMKTYLKFDKKEDITLDLGAKMREIGSNVGEQMKASIEEYFDNPNNRVAVPVELVMSGKNQATLEGGNITITGGVGGGGITAEDLMKLLTTPIEVKIQDQQQQQQQQKSDSKLINIDRGGEFAEEVVDVFDKLIEAAARTGKNANDIKQFFSLKNINLDELGKLSGSERHNAIIDAFENLLEQGDKALLDRVNSLASGSTKNVATTSFKQLVKESVFRYDLKQISSQEDAKRSLARDLVVDDYIPRNLNYTALSQIRNTNNPNYKLPTVEELRQLITELPQTWGTLGQSFVPALEALKKLLNTIKDPTNAQEIQKFKDAADKFANETNSDFFDMKGEMKNYRIGVFKKNHNKYQKNADRTYQGGAYSGSKILDMLDDIDYFEIYDDPSAHMSKGNRKDAADHASRLERLELKRSAKKASYRSEEHKPTGVFTNDIEVKTFEPKERPNEELQDIEATKEAAEKRADKIEEARKASEKEEKAAEELRKQQLEADKKRRTALKGQKTKNEKRIDKIVEETGTDYPQDLQQLVGLREKARLEKTNKSGDISSRRIDFITEKLKENPKATKEQVDAWKLEFNQHPSIVQLNNEVANLEATMAIIQERIEKVQSESMVVDDKAKELKEKNTQLAIEIDELDERIDKNSVEPSKKPTVKQQLDAMPKAKDIQEMIDNVNEIDIKVDEAQKKAEELDKFVEKNFKAEKNVNVGYTKSEKNNSDKHDAATSRLATLNQVLNDKSATTSLTTGMTAKDRDIVKQLLTDRKINQLINSEQGLGLPQNSNLERIAQERIRIYQENLSKIDEFLLKHQGQTFQYVEDDADFAEFWKDNNIRTLLAGNFKGSKEDEAAIQSKIEEFKTRMTKVGKSYIVDYIDMWSDSGLRDLMKDNRTRTATDAQGDSILQEFYRRVIEGGISKRGEAYQYLKDESAKYQKNIEKDENALAKQVAAASEQVKVTSDKDVAANDRVKEKYREYIAQWLQTIQTNMTDIASSEIGNEEKALKLKKNDELRKLIGDMSAKYFKDFGEALLTEDQSAILKNSGLTYQGFKKQKETDLIAERTTKQAEVDAVIAQKAELLKQRRFDLLKNISSRVNKGEDTANLEKALSEIESELINYSNELPHVLRDQFEADLLVAKNATEEQWKQFKENSTKRQSEYDVAKYTELKGKQKSLLGEISTKHQTGESTDGLQKQLEALNAELVKYEVNTARMSDIKKSMFPDDASERAIRMYNTEMAELVKLLQEKALLEAQGESVVEIDRKIAVQKKRVVDQVRNQIDADKQLAAQYDPKTQAANFLEATDRDMYELQQQEAEARRKLSSAQARLATMQGDKYYDSNIYKDRIDSLKEREVKDFIASGQYAKARDEAIKQADREFGEYLAQHFDEDVVNSIVYEFSENKDRADVDTMLTPRLREILAKRNELRKKMSETDDDIIREDLLDKWESLREEYQAEAKKSGAGITTRLVDNAFADAMKKERDAYINSDEYKKLKAERKEARNKEVEAELGATREENQAKIQEIWNATKAKIKQIKKSTLENSEELRAAVDFQAQADGMGDSTEYKRAIVDRVKEDLIQQAIESGRAEQKTINTRFRDAIAAKNPAMYKELGEQADKVAYNAVMSKMRKMLGKNANIIEGLDAKRNEFVDKNVQGIIDRVGIGVTESGIYKGVNVREQLEKELAHEVAYYAQMYTETSGKLGALQHQRDRAILFGELGTTEIDNPEVARVRAEAEARLTAEKERQINLTEKLTALTAQNADKEAVNSVASALEATNREIERLQLLTESASSALTLRQEAKDEADAEQKFDPEKLRLWYIDSIAQARKQVEDGVDDPKLQENIDRWERKLTGIEKYIEASKPEAEKPKTILDMITYAIRDGLAGVTAGGTVNLDASLYNIATETTLQEILRLLGGNGAVEYANQLKAELDKYRPKYEKRSDGEVQDRAQSNTRSKYNKDFDKLNADGQRIFGELEAEAKAFTTSLKKGNKQYATDFDFVKAIKDQVAVVKKQTQGSLEYVKEQTKLTLLYQDYYNKTFGKGKKKSGQPGQSKWAEQGDLGKIKGLKDLLLFKNQRADALVGLNYGVAKNITDETPVKSNNKKSNKKKNAKVTEVATEVTSAPEQADLQQTIMNAIQAAQGDDNSSGLDKVLGAVMQTLGLDPNDADVAKIIGDAINGDGLGRDEDVKTEIKEGVKEGVVESSKTSTSNKNLPYDIAPDSLIGKLQNTVGGDTNALAKQATLALVLSELQAISKKIPTVGKAGVKSSAQNLLEEFQKMALGSAMDSKERVSNFDLVNGAMSPALSGAAHSISQKLLDTLSEQYGVGQGYRSQVHTHADSDQTWFSAKDLDHFKKNLGEFGADSIKQQVLLTKDNITVFDMTMVETAEKAALAIDILKKAGSNIDNEALEKLTELGARYQSKDLSSIGAKGLMDLLGVKNYKNDGKKKNSTLTEPEFENRQKEFEAFAQRRADALNSQYIFKNFDGDTFNYQLVDMEGKISKVALAWDEVENQIREVSNTSTSSLDPVIKKIQQYKSEIQSAQQEKLLLDGDDTNFVAAEKAVDDVIAKIQNLDPEKDDLNALLNELANARQKLADEGTKLHKLIAQNEKRRGGTAEVKQAITQGAKIRSLVGNAIETNEQDGLQLFSVGDDAPKYLREYVAEYNALIQAQQQYIKDGSINSAQTQDALKVQTAGVKKLGIVAMAAYKNTQALQEASDHWKNQTYTDKAGNTHALGGSTIGTGVDKEAMLQYAKSVLGADLANIKLNTTTGKLTGVLRKNNYVVADMAVQYDKSTGKMHLFQEKERESLSGMPGFLHGLKQKSRAIIQYVASMTSIYRVLGEIRKGIQYIRDIDLALTELKKVTDETEETYRKFLDTASKTAAKVGSTIKDVISSTADWARLGYSMEQAAKFAETTQILMNVSEFTDVSQATDTLISAVQAFGYTADTSMEVVDLLNTIGNNYAISTADLAKSLTKSSASLVAAGGDLAEAAALTATANKIVQDADSVGTALKTTSLRLRGTDVKVLEEEGLDSEGAVTSKSKLQSKVKALSGVDILTETGAYKSTYEILSQIANVWEKMNDMDQAALLELISGKRNSSVVAAILQNPEELKAAFEDANNAQGSALEENEKYLDSIQGKIDQFNNSIQTLWTNTLDSGTVKFFVDLATDVIKFVDSIGFLNTALAGLFVYFTAIKKNNPITIIKDFGNSMINAGLGATQATVSLRNLTVEQQAAKMATAGYTQEQIRANLIKHNNITAERAELLATEASTVAIETKTAATAEGVLADWAENKVGLSNQAVDWLEKLSTDALTRAKLLEAVATGAITKQDYFEIAAKYGLLTATERLKLGVQGLIATIEASMASNPVGWILMAISAIVMLVQWVSTWQSKTEKLTEELDGMKTELQNIQSELDSVNSELETTQKRMAELIAMPSLSFVEQEELNRLKEQNEELERTERILKAQEEREKRQVAKKAAETVKSQLSGIELGGNISDAFTTNLGNTMAGAAAGAAIGGTIGSFIPVVGNVVGAAVGTVVGGVAANLVSTEDKINQEMERRTNLQSEKEDLAKKLETASDSEYEDIKKEYDKTAEELDKTESYIDSTLQQMGEALKDVEYGYGADEELDAYYNLFYKNEISRGTADAKSDGLGHIFSRPEHKALKEDLDKWVQALKDGDKNAKAEIDKLLTNSSDALKADIKAMGLDIEDAIGYWTQIGAEANFSTLEGKIKDITTASTAMTNTLNGLQSGSIDINTLFDEEGKVIQTKLSELFQDTSEQTRKDATRILENAYQGIADGLDENEITALVGKFGLTLSASLLDVKKTLQAESNLELFPNLEEELSGIIDTFDELSSAVSSVVDAMDTLEQARAEEAHSGSISLETMMKLMEYTDDYTKIMKIDEYGAIKLVEGAEDVLIDTKLARIKEDAELALYSAEVAYQDALTAEQEAIHAEQTVNVSSPAQEWYRDRLADLASMTAYVGSLVDSINNANIDGMFDRAKEAANKAKLEKAAGYEAEKTQIAEAVTTARLSVADKKKARDEAEDRKKWADALTPENLKTKATSEDASGGKKTAEEVADDAFQKEMDYWENRIAANQAKYEQLQNEIDLLEAKGQKADASYYQEQVELESQRLELLRGQRQAAIDRLAVVEAEFGKGSEEWWEVANILNDIESELDDVTASIVDLQDAIGEIDTYKFEEFNTRLDDLTSKLETIRNLIAPDGEEDWFDDEGNWTEEGVAVLGSYLQELETYKQGLAKAEDAYKSFAYKTDDSGNFLTDEDGNLIARTYAGNEAWYADNYGIHSEQEYYDRQEELIGQQYDYMSSISDTEQEIVGMYESSIDAVEEYTETLIDSYNDYIDSVKEALDAERDLYDFKKNVQKQAKDIAEIERRIASLSGSTNAADIAERRKLEAQLYESRESLNDTYYDHAKDSQNEALDAEQTAYEESMTKFVEGLRTSLEEAAIYMDEFLMGVTSMVMYNADTVLSKYQETNLPLTAELTNPWEKAKEATNGYSGNALTLMNEWTKQGGFFAQFNTSGTTNLTSPWSAGTNAATSFRTDVASVMSGVVSNIASNVKSASGELSSLYSQIQDTERRAASANVSVGSGSSSGSSGTTTPQKKYYVTAFLDMGSRSFSVTKSDSNETTAMSLARTAILGEYEKYKGNSISAESAWQRTWRDKVKYTTQYYAKGTTGTSRDEWAITDEPRFGDELVLVPGKDGNLSFMRKGTGVVPADLTANLMEWGQFTPDSLNLNGGANINMINNAINKPEFNLSFEALVKAERIDENTLPEVKKYVQQEINSLVKQMNYAIKGKGGR